MNKKIWLPIVIGITALLLITVLGAIFVFPVRTALANTLVGRGIGSVLPWWSGWHGGPDHGSGITLPAQLQSLASIPSAQRFDHFMGAQVNLKDEQNQPLTVNIIPGKVTSASTTSLTIAANDGSSPTITLNDQTMIHSETAATPAATGTPAALSPLQKDDQVIVVTLNGSRIATAVLAVSPSGFGWPGQGGWWGRRGKGQ